MSQPTVLLVISALALLSCGVNGNDGDPCARCADGACAPECLGIAGEWEGPVLLWQGDVADAPDCPDAAPELLLDGYGELNDATLPCGICSCGPSLCSFPSEVMVSSHENCEYWAPGGVERSLPIPEGWDGTCMPVRPVDTNEFRSIVFYGTTFGECLPQQAPLAAFPSAVPWDRFGRACTTREPLMDCGEATGGCSPLSEPSPPSFARCVRSVIGDAPCPAGYPEQRVLYAGLEDARFCSPCTCGPQHGGVCDGALVVWSGDGCSQVRNGSDLAATDGTGCSVPLPDREIRAMNGWFTDVQLGVCDPSGGEPVGEVTPLDPTVFCCETPADAES